jgi:hypothetical protein
MHSLKSEALLVHYLARIVVVDGVSLTPSTTSRDLDWVHVELHEPRKQHASPSTR